MINKTVANTKVGFLRILQTFNPKKSVPCLGICAPHQNEDWGKEEGLGLLLGGIRPPSPPPAGIKFSSLGGLDLHSGTNGRKKKKGGDGP